MNPNIEDSVSINELAATNGIDLQENGIYADLGLRLLSVRLPVRIASVNFLKIVKALQGPGKTVWQMRSRGSSASRRIVDGWVDSLASVSGVADVIIVDSDFDDGPVVIDGHHRVVAALEVSQSLRYVDLADLPR